jgi:hypothetical protein
MVRTILSDHSKTVGGTVFVVGGSEVFHRTVSCEFAQDARRSQVAESTAKKHGLRVCKHCKNEADAPGLAPISESSAFADAPDAPDVPVSAKNSTKAQKKATKHQRDTAEAHTI